MFSDRGRFAFIWRPSVAWAAVGFFSLGIYAMMTLARTPRQLASSVPHADKIPHAVLFGFLAWLLAWALSSRQKRPSAHPLVLLAAFSIATLFGVCCEIWQKSIPGRTFDLWDMVANAVGALVAVFFWRIRARDQAESDSSSLSEPS